MTKLEKRPKAKKRRAQMEIGDKTYLDVADDIDRQFAYLIEITGLLLTVFHGEIGSSIPLANVLDDLHERLERLKATIKDLKAFCGK